MVLCLGCALIVTRIFAVQVFHIHHFTVDRIADDCLSYQRYRKTQTLAGLLESLMVCCELQNMPAHLGCYKFDGKCHPGRNMLLGQVV